LGIGLVALRLSTAGVSSTYKHALFGIIQGIESRVLFSGCKIRRENLWLVVGCQYTNQRFSLRILQPEKRTLIESKDAKNAVFFVMQHDWVGSVHMPDSHKGSLSTQTEHHLHKHALPTGLSSETEELPSVGRLQVVCGIVFRQEDIRTRPHQSPVSDDSCKRHMILKLCGESTEIRVINSVFLKYNPFVCSKPSDLMNTVMI
jgi:hypothetical protein